MSSPPAHGLVAIVPCNDLDRSEAFYAKLGLVCEAPKRYDDYRILSDGRGGRLHLTTTPPGWVVAEKNPFGVYLYTDQVDAIAERVRDSIIERSKQPEHKPWGMYELSLSDPDGTLVRIGWPSDATRAR